MLAATGILEVKTTTDGSMWVVGQEAMVLEQEPSIGLQKYNMDIYLVGINQHPRTRIHVHTPVYPAAL